MSLLHIDITHVLKILPQVRPRLTYSTQSIPWLLMPWRRKEPRHEQPWYWPSQIEITRSRTLSVKHIYLSFVAPQQQVTCALSNTIHSTLDSTKVASMFLCGNVIPTPTNAIVHIHVICPDSEVKYRYIYIHQELLSYQHILELLVGKWITNICQWIWNGKKDQLK